MSVPKAVTKGDWQRNATGRPYRYIDIEGQRYCQWDSTTGPVLAAQPTDSPIPRSIRQDSQSTTATTTLGSSPPAATTTFGSYPPAGHQPAYSLFPREPARQSPSLAHATTSVGQSTAGAAGDHRGNVVPNQLDRSLQVDQKRTTLGRHENESQARNTSSRDSLALGQTSTKDQPSYPPGTRKIVKRSDRTYCYGGDDKLIAVVAATRPETRLDQGKSASQDLTARFENMGTHGRSSEEKETYRVRRPSIDQGAPLQATHGDPWASSKQESDPRNSSQSASSEPKNIPGRPDMTRHYSQESGIGAQDERGQSRERARNRRPQYDEEDDDEDDDERSARPAKDPRRPLIQAQPRGQSQGATADNPLAQQPIINNIRRPSVTRGPDLATISESGLLKTSKIVADNKARSEVMDERYYIHKDAKTFFAAGRVFAMLWHENAGNEGTDLSEGIYYHGKLGQKIYSTIRRMVVVSQKHGHCICVPILTYGKRGTLKSGLSDADIKAHAVIYMINTSSVPALGEKIVKNPIAVKPAKADQKLHPMSRVNFDKIYTVEHNVRVMNVGKVAEESMHNLWLYFYNTHLGGN